jgi:hypothetical protein
MQGVYVMLSGVAELVIQGITVDGNLFQEPEWPGKLCDMLATIGDDGRKVYSAYVQPVVVDGVAAVVVLIALEKVDPDAFNLVKQFVAQNKLMVRSGRGSRDAEATGVHPVIGMERRKTGQ